ncbi:MAG: Crp/Fnr family transcriptional regulator [Pacificimonas sp.]
MSVKTNSCLVAKLGHFIDLHETDAALLAHFEAQQQDYKKRDIVRRENDPIENLFVVKSGWFYGYTMLPSGKRQVHRLFFAGDLIGTHEVVCEKATYDIAAASSGTLCPFAKNGLTTVFTNSPRLTALLYSIEALEQVAQDDRLRAIARMDAVGRLAHLFLQIFARHRITHSDFGPTMKLEMSQELIGDTVGLTGIHVNRTLKQMGEEGMIRMEGSHLTLLDKPAMERLCSFDDRHYKIDTSWFPAK